MKLLVPGGAEGHHLRTKGPSQDGTEQPESLHQAAAAVASVDQLQRTSDWEFWDDMRRVNSGSEERPRLAAALSCLRSATAGDVDHPGGSTPFCGPEGEVPPDSCGSEPQEDVDVFSLSSPISCLQLPTTTAAAAVPHGRSVSISVLPCSDVRTPEDPPEGADPEPSVPRTWRPQLPKSSRTPPPAARKLLQLFPSITLTRNKSQESQLPNRVEEPGTPRSRKRSRAPAGVQLNGCGSPEDPSLPSVLTLVPGTPSPLDSAYRSSPQTPRRDIGLAVTHRFSTRSWLSQTCQVCRRSMMFGVKCKHCRLKCHNKCTKDAPPCRISFLTFPRMRRAESVPSDINNRIDQTAVNQPPQFGTLPKTMNRREPAPTVHQLDSSSNASSATSSGPSSPVPLQQSNPSSVSTTPPPNPSTQGARENDCFHFPDVPAVPPSGSHLELGQPQLVATETQMLTPEKQEASPAEDEEAAERCGAEHELEEDEEREEDELEDLPTCISRRRGCAERWRDPISRKVSQTSVYLQEWDIPYEQLQLDELIGKGRWGKVHKGRWHGEVAIRLLEVDGNNQEHLKLFKKEVMNYRQTRHENVILFMGACMVPPHLAIITSFCKGLTLYSMVRERPHMLDLNKTRQIAQDIVNGMSYLHAKGIVHKDLKSKNVFYDSNKVVITDFGLFGMSGLVQEGRKKNVLRIPHGWIYYLAPEIVKQMSPEVDEDQLPFSKAADVYAFGTIWYELQNGNWPLTGEPVEAKIWLLGSSEGVRKVLAAANLGKEITEILSTCWSSEADDRPTFTQLAQMLERLPKLNRRLSHPGHF